MATKKKPAVGSPADLDDMTVEGNEDQGVAAGGVALRMLNGYAAFWPANFDRLDPDTRQLCEMVLGWVARRRELAGLIDVAAVELRQLGMSWSQLGWLVGLTSEGARQRWGEVQ